MAVFIAVAALGLRVQAQVTLSGSLVPLELESFQTCVFTAAHADGAPQVWEWSVREPGGGGFTRKRQGPRNLYRAPRVTEEQIFHIQVRVKDSPEPMAECAIRVLPSPIPIIAAKERLRSGESCRLGVLPGDARPRVFTWSVQEADGGTFTDVGLKGVTRYRAPRAVESRTLHICATDPLSGARSVLPMKVEAGHTGLEARDKVFGAGLVGAVHGPGWVEPSSELTLFKEFRPIDYPRERRSNFRFGSYPASPILGIHFVADPAMGALDGSWLINDDEGLVTVSRSGEMTRLPLRMKKSPTDPDFQSLPPTACTAVAVRPPGSHGHNPRHVVVALALDPDPHYGLFDLAPDGTLTALKITRHRDYFPDSTDPHHSVGALVHKRDDVDWNYTIDAMAMDTTGNLFVVKGNSWVERISPMGVKSLVAGLPTGFFFLNDLDRHGHGSLYSPGARDGFGVKAGFGRIRGLAVDSERQQLYVTDGDALRLITHAGEVRTLIGKAEEAGFAPVPPPGPGLLPGQACLNGPASLLLDRGILFIADQGNHAVRSYNPRTGELWTVLGDPGQGVTRFGPAACFAPDNLPEECAALIAPNSVGLAPGADGACTLLVVHRYGLACMDLPGGCFGSSHPEPKEVKHR